MPAGGGGGGAARAGGGSGSGSDDDLFGGAHALEERHIARGAADGAAAGEAAGAREGRRLGVQQGYAVGLEVGFYAGAAQAWRSLQRAGEPLPARAERGLAALEALLAAAPLTRPQDEALHEALEAMRGRFKALASLLSPGGLAAAAPGAPGGGDGAPGAGF